MHLLVDAQLPPRLARPLAEAGYRAEHVKDLGLRDASNTAIWLHEQAIIVTKDADFVEKFRRQPGGPLIVWLRIGNAANSVLPAWFSRFYRLSWLEFKAATGLSKYADFYLLPKKRQ
jgi:predicted nuclease of predicted toxin-antitoxin system